jgi:predicted transcriptional regulator of viral defense system
MVTNNTNTILSAKDLKIFEKAILNHGRIIKYNDLKNFFKDEYGSSAEISNRISLLSKLGWLLRIKNGLYVIVSDYSSLGFNDLSIILIARSLNKKSYISFENALQFHGVYDQMLSTVESVTTSRARKYDFQNTIIKFLKIKKEYYFGFSKQRIDLDFAEIADLEKAILDMIYFRKSSYNLDLIWEILKKYRSNFNFQKLKNYAKKLNNSVLRQTGFMLDNLSIDTNDLYESVKSKKSYTRMTENSNKFNSKWRLYFDNNIIK